jgi:hypothetical protein
MDSCELQKIPSNQKKIELLMRVIFEATDTSDGNLKLEVIDRGNKDFYYKRQTRKAISTLPLFFLKQQIQKEYFLVLISYILEPFFVQNPKINRKVILKIFQNISICYFLQTPRFDNARFKLLDPKDLLSQSGDLEKEKRMMAIIYFVSILFYSWLTLQFNNADLIMLNDVLNNQDKSRKMLLSLSNKENFQIEYPEITIPQLTCLSELASTEVLNLNIYPRPKIKRKYSYYSFEKIQNYAFELPSNSEIISEFIGYFQ